MSDTSSAGNVGVTRRVGVGKWRMLPSRQALNGEGICIL